MTDVGVIASGVDVGMQVGVGEGVNFGIASPRR